MNDYTFGWYCKKCRFWIKPREEGDPLLYMVCPKCYGHAFISTPLRVKYDDLLQETARLRRIEKTLREQKFIEGKAYYGEHVNWFIADVLDGYR